MVALGAIRTSSEQIYDSKWGIFSCWCIQRQDDPVNTSMEVGADFFLHLFNDRGQTVSTIQGYRAAINSVWTITGRNISEDEITSRLFSAYKLKRPRSLVQVPRWDLAVVLCYLKQDRFSRSYLTCDPGRFAAKTAVLLLLASARRCGDIHAIDQRKTIWRRRSAFVDTICWISTQGLGGCRGKQ